MKVLICDDLPDRGKEIVTAVEDAQQQSVEIEELFGPDLTDELGKLFKNVGVVLNPNDNVGRIKRTKFDDADLVILDNNLTSLKITGARITAESIAGYVRAFSAAPYVVSLNKNPDVDFDLRYLMGDYQSKADLALNTHHLSNPALWTHNPDHATDGFLPWYWPKLLDIADKRRKQIKFVSLRLQKPVLKSFGFDRKVIEYLSRHGRGALSPAAELGGTGEQDIVVLEDVTFLDVFKNSSHPLPASPQQERQSDQERLSDKAIAGHKNSRKIICRIVAAEIERYVRRDLLGPQEVLVDIPHLLMRLPFLLGERASEITGWNAAIEAGSVPPYGIDQTLFDKHMKRVMFNYDIWVESPCFLWPKVKEDKKLNEKFFEKEPKWPDVVFCEDRSTFVPRSPADDSPAPVEFAAEFESSWNRRHVAVAGIRYAPKSRFAV